MRIFSYFNNKDNNPSALDIISGLKLLLLDILNKTIINSKYKALSNLSEVLKNV